MSKRGESFSTPQESFDASTEDEESDRLLPVMISDEHGVDGVLPIMVYVTAPLALSEGSTFQAYVNEEKSRPFTVKVPPGGVYNGQVFMVPLPSSDDTERLTAPTGRWKDGFCDCFSRGLFHPSFCCAWCCGLIALGQVMTRMSLNWCGKPVSRAASKETFFIMCCLFMADLLLAFLGLKNDMWTLIGYLLAVWAAYARCQTRQSVRLQYSIPGNAATDCLASSLCSCCTISQLARHTGEYETYPGVCLSSTGHPEGAPMTV